MNHIYGPMVIKDNHEYSTIDNATKDGLTVSKNQGNTRHLNVQRGIMPQIDSHLKLGHFQTLYLWSG